MCFCCCVTRKSILIYAIVISSFAFISGIVAIAKFGSSTKIYKALVNRLKELEKENQYSYDYDNFDDYYNNNNNNNNYNNNNYNNYNYNSYYKTKGNRRNSNKDNDYYPYVNPYNSEFAKAVLDSASYFVIIKLGSRDLNQKSYGLIKSLKGIENGLGVILFIFSLIFLIIEIILMITICGIKEFQVLSDKTYKVFDTIRILCITFSTILIFLSILYSILLVIVFVQYIKLLNIDSCSIGVIIGMAYGYYGLWYYIILSCAFCNERTLFLKVGCESKPGPDAQYRLNGDHINRNQGTTQIVPIIFGNSNQNLQNSPTIQVYNNDAKNKVKLSNSNGVGDEYIKFNGILYKRVDKLNNNNINYNVKARNKIRRNSKKKGSIKSQKRHSKSNIIIPNNHDKISQNSKNILK